MAYALQKLDEWIALDVSTFNTVPENDFPSQRRKLLDALSYLKKIDDNWNGHDAIKPSRQAIAMAEHFVSHLFLTKYHANYIEPDGDGGIVLVWKSENYNILLTIDGTHLHLSYKTAQEDPIFIENIPFFDTEENILPNEILEYIPDREV